MKSVKENYNRLADYTHAQAYDAVKLVAAAMTKAGSTDKAKVRDALKTVEINGARGVFKFDAKGDPTHSAAMIAVKGGKEVDASE